MITRKIVLVMTLGVLVSVALAVEKVGVSGSDTEFDSTIQKTILGKPVTLVLTGTALREKYWLNIYSIGSYLKQGIKVESAEKLALVDVPKQLHIILEREVDGQSMGLALKESIIANHPNGFEGELKKLIDYLSTKPIEKGNHVWITHLPGKGLSCKITGKKEIIIENVAFANAFWEIYFGEKNIGVAIKKDLSSRL